MLRTTILKVKNVRDITTITAWVITPSSSRAVGGIEVSASRTFTPETPNLEIVKENTMDRYKNHLSYDLVLAVFHHNTHLQPLRMISTTADLAAGRTFNLPFPRPVLGPGN